MAQILQGRLSLRLNTGTTSQTLFISPRGIKRLACIGAVSALIICTAACSSTVPPSANTSYEGRDVSSSTQDSDRQAGLFKKIHVCVINNSSQNVKLSWSWNMLDEKGNMLAKSDTTKDMGYQDKACTLSSGVTGIEKSIFTLGTSNIEIWNNLDPNMKLNVDGNETFLKPNAPVRQPLNNGQQPSIFLEAVTNGMAVTYGTIKAYPVEIVLTD